MGRAKRITGALVPRRAAAFGQVILLGWEKALGDDAELGWWLDRAVDGLGRL